MKIAGKDFSLEELLLCLGLTIFFVAVFVGAWAFNPDSALFPIMLSGPALVLLALYVFQGALPAGLRNAISSSDRFAIGKKPEGVVAEGEGEADEGDENSVYFIFAYTAAFALLAWAVGFYIAALVGIAAYLAKVRAEIRRVGVVAVVLVVLAIGMIYLFDSAFGHHYGSGAFFSFR